MQKMVDFVVVGSGIAGLHAALTLAKFGKVLIITKGKISDGSTNCAQGGIAAVTNKNDSNDSHIQDTLHAGAHHNNKEAVSFLVEQGAAAIEELIALGIAFDKDSSGEYITSFEAAHSYPRIFHATDFTGQAIEKSLVSAVRKTDSIEIWEGGYAVDLIGEKNICFGVQVLYQDIVSNVFARATVLATGGVGQLYQWTTNPSVVTGDGIAIAYRAGARLQDMEFVQFHPTALKENSSPLFLLSEALRGEGGILVDSFGTEFMEALHPQGDLAPRDVVARAIFQKQKTGDVYLDIRHKGKDFITKRFPNIYLALKARGFDLTTDLIPVTPAAHFLCGGICTDVYGRTSIKHLFAYGEVAATGVHGANRLASNSLLEGFVFSGRIKECISSLRTSPQTGVVISSSFKKFPRDYFGLWPRNDGVQNEIQKIMWEKVGIERTPQDLFAAIQELSELQKQNKEDIILNNMITTALLITKAAKKRKESLGAHYIV